MTDAARSDYPLSSVDDVLITAELASRPSRAPDYESESRALGLLAQEMATHPGGVLRRCAELTMELCNADSAGISIFEPGGRHGVFRWHAAVGGFAAHLYGTLPREASPCGIVMNRNRVLLFNEPERFFPALRGVEPRFFESLLAPWQVDGEPIGTLWALKHAPEGRFEREDARLMQNLARFAAAAFQMTSALDDAKTARDGLERRVMERTDALSSAYERMHQTEARLQAAIDLVGLSPYTWDPATGALEWDTRLRAMWGLPPEAHVDEEVWRSGIHPEERPRVEAAVARCLDPEGDGLYHIEYRVIGIGDGVERWISTQGRTTFQNGRPVGFVGVALDVTDRKRAETALRESESRLAHELDGARQLQRISSGLLSEQRPQALYEQILDAMMAVMQSQGASMQILERRTGTLKLLAWRGFHPQAAAFWERVDANGASACGEALKTARRILVSDIETCEFMAGSKDLEAYRLSNLRAVQSTPLRSRTGGALGMVSTHWCAPHEPSVDDFSRFDVLTRQAADLIERARTEAALRKSEERSRQFADASPDVLWIRNADMLKMEYANPAFEHVYGQPRPEAPGKDASEWSALIHPDDRAAALAAVERVRGGERVTHEFRLLRRDGQTRWIENTDFPLFDRRGQVQLIGGFAKDVTEKKEIAERMKVLIAELQHRTRNLIGVVRSISDRTMAGSSSLDEYKDGFGHRLAALARVNGLLSRLDESDRISFDELLRTELAGHGVFQDGHEHQVILDGPRGIPLRSSTVQTLALGLHELATNAVKHGALSRPEGRLLVQWREVCGDNGEPRLRLEWQESGVPLSLSSEVPSLRQGYGRELIEHALPYQLGAETDYELTPEGVRCIISLPISTHYKEAANA
jgi:PAS domain S-box-containing protein